jgi:hypothetical protein
LAYSWHMAGVSLEHRTEEEEEEGENEEKEKGKQQ